MKLIIDIPEDTKNRLCFGITYQKDIQTICDALNNSTPLDEMIEKLEAVKILREIVNDDIPMTYLH